MPVTGGGTPPNINDPTSYLDPPKGMTQAQALEEVANQALRSGAVSNGAFTASPGTAAPLTGRSFRPGMTRPHANPRTNAFVGAGPHVNAPFGIPKSQRFHEPAPTPQQEVITAYKRAKLLFTTKKVRIVGAVESEYDFDHEMVAECKHPSGHPPGAPVPAKSHTCGFYAMYRLEDIEESFYTSNCTLECQMFGRVVKGKTGCRAEKQRIIGVLLDARSCDGLLCAGQPMALGMPAGMKLDGREPEEFQALCRAHFDGYDPLRRISLSHLRNATGLEFRFATDRPEPEEDWE